MYILRIYYNSEGEIALRYVERGDIRIRSEAEDRVLWNLDKDLLLLESTEYNEEWERRISQSNCRVENGVPTVDLSSDIETDSLEGSET